MNRLMHVTAFASLFLLISSCEDRKGDLPQSPARDAGAKLEGMFAQGQASVLTAARRQLADLEQVISDFKQRAATSSGDAKVELEEGIKTLDASGASLKQKLEPLTNARGEGWKEIAKEFDIVVTQMRKTIADVRGKMK